MKKIINKKIYTIRYEGTINELEAQLECLALEWGERWTSQLEKIGEIDKEISSQDQRIYYNSDRIIYVPNFRDKKMIFPIILMHSKNADKLFLKNHPEYKIRVER